MSIVVDYYIITCLFCAFDNEKLPQISTGVNKNNAFMVHVEKKSLKPTRRA